jgi:hypothetical protein
MIKAQRTVFLVVLGSVLGGMFGIGAALAQPAPPNPNVPKPPGTKPPEKGTESLGEGGAVRPWAVGVSVEQQQTALRLFRDGNIHHKDGLFANAVEVYREALKSWDHPAIHYNLALSLSQLDYPVELKDKLDKIKEMLGWVGKQLATIEVSCQKVGAKVFVDRREVFTVAANAPNKHTARVRVGKHTFHAEKRGFISGSDAPFIEPGDTYRIELKVYTDEDLTRYKRRWDAKWMPYAVIAGGVVAGVTGGLLANSAQKSFDDYDEAVARCNDMTPGMTGGCTTTSSLTDMRESGESKRTMSYVGYGVAGAAITTGLVLVYLNRERAYLISESEYRKEQLLKEQKKVTVLPIVTPEMGGAMVHVSF